MRSSNEKLKLSSVPTKIIHRSQLAISWRRGPDSGPTGSLPLLESKVAEGEREASEEVGAHPDAPWQAGGPSKEPGRQ